MGSSKRRIGGRIPEGGRIRGGDARKIRIFGSTDPALQRSSAPEIRRSENLQSRSSKLSSRDLSGEKEVMCPMKSVWSSQIESLCILFRRFFFISFRRFSLKIRLHLFKSDSPEEKLSSSPPSKPSPQQSEEQQPAKASAAWENVVVILSFTLLI